MTCQRSLLILLAPVALLATTAFASVHRQGSELIVSPYHASGIYALGETVGWNVALRVTAPVSKFSYKILKNNAVLVQSGDLDLSSGHATIEIKVDDPTMLYTEIVPPTGRHLFFGAAVAPTKLTPVAPRPKDFDAFWKRKISGLEAIPENPVLTPGDSGNPNVEYSTVKLDHVNGTHVYGQLAKPKKPGKYPALLILQWASPPYRLWSPWVVDRAAEGWIALNIEPHDVLPTEPQSYYDALPTTLKNYGSIGQEDRDLSYFVEMYLRDYRAVDYLTHLRDWDGKTLVVMGTSMGGQQTFAVAGLHPKVTHLIVEVPAGCDLNAALHGRQEGYPFFPTNNPKVMNTAQYVDCINFAPHIKATSLVAMGFVDTVSPPAGVWTVFNLIKGQKEAAPMVDAPHNNFATAEQQRPFTERAAYWLSQLVKDERPTLNKPDGLR